MLLLYKIHTDKNFQFNKKINKVFFLLKERENVIHRRKNYRRKKYMKRKFKKGNSVIYSIIHMKKKIPKFKK